MNNLSQCEVDQPPADDTDAGMPTIEAREGFSVGKEHAESRSAREEEFITLLTRHKHQVFNLIFCIVHSLPDTEDVFQQAMIVLWSKFDEFQRGTDFGAWASRVARYRALNFIRSKRRDRLHFSEDLISHIAECEFDSAEVQDARLRALAACRQKLSQSDQMLLSVCYGGETTISEASKLVGRPVRSVYDSLARIRGALYDCIARTLSREGYL